MAAKSLELIDRPSHGRLALQTHHGGPAGLSINGAFPALRTDVPRTQRRVRHDHLGAAGVGLRGNTPMTWPPRALPWVLALRVAGRRRGTSGRRRSLVG